MENGLQRLQIEECLKLLLNEVSKQDKTETVYIDDACGRVVAGDIYADINVPHFPKSAMDGYAVKAGDVCGATKDNPVKLEVAGELLAGDYEEYEYRKGTAIRVMTGAYVPNGYDAVIRQEDTDYGMDNVMIYTDIKEYVNYCKVGEDINKGELVVAKGARLSPGYIGIMASLGIFEAQVYKKARVAIISTGSELMELGKEILPGKIYNSIAHMIMASVKEKYLDVAVNEICPDEESLLTDKINYAVDHSDFVITTGAVSVGKKDIVPKVLDDMGAKRIFKGALIQPGTPTMASVLRGKPILSLSGNPYAALANFQIYFWPAMAKFMQCDELGVKKSVAVLQSEYTKQNRMRRLIRAYEKNGMVWIPSNVHSSSVIHNLTECNCMIDLEADRNVNIGDRVNIIYL